MSISHKLSGLGPKFKEATLKACTERMQAVGFRLRYEEELDIELYLQNKSIVDVVVKYVFALDERTCY